MAGFPPPPQQHTFIGSSTQMEHSGSQGMEAKIETSQNDPLMTTLLVRHLPEGIPHHTLSRLFSHYGAHSVRPCTAGRLRNCAFVDFKNDAVAYQAQRQLNRLRFLGKVLVVERANKRNEEHRGKQSGDQGRKENVAPMSIGREFNVDSKPGPFPGSEPIAPKLGVDYPFPPHLEYAYPPPDGNILTNILNALIAVPRFYTQVLHLMNKMNIPAPFRMALPTPPLPPSESAPAPPPPPPPPPLVESNRQSADASSSDESELETSEEDVDDKPRRKRRRREAIVGPAVDKQVAHEAVGLKLASLLPKEIPVIKKKNPMLQIKIVPKEVQKENKDSGVVEAASVEAEIQTPDDKAFASPEEIRSNKLAPEEILSLPKFKNYTVGNPTTVLYIKNLGKDVVPDDFSYVFGSIFGSTEAAKAGLNVKLMHEGRMRGQAFVTFPSVELAHQALNLVNGYMFKGKPMIVQFGRNPSAGRQDQ